MPLFQVGSAWREEFHRHTSSLQGLEFRGDGVQVLGTRVGCGLHRSPGLRHLLGSPPGLCGFHGDEGAAADLHAGNFVFPDELKGCALAQAITLAELWNGPRGPGG